MKPGVNQSPVQRDTEVDNYIRLGLGSFVTDAASASPPTLSTIFLSWSHPAWLSADLLLSTPASSRAVWDGSGGRAVVAVAAEGEGAAGRGGAAIPGAALRFGRPCVHAATSSSSSSSMTCPRFSSSIEWWTLLLCGRTYPQCSLCSYASTGAWPYVPVIMQRQVPAGYLCSASFQFIDRVVASLWTETGSRGKTVEIPQVQFLDNLFADCGEWHIDKAVDVPGIMALVLHLH